MNVRVPIRVLLAVLLALPLTGCLFRSHRPSVLMTNAPLKTAALPDLLAEINNNAAKVQTLNATVDIANERLMEAATNDFAARLQAFPR